MNEKFKRKIGKTDEGKYLGKKKNNERYWTEIRN